MSLIQFGACPLSPAQTRFTLWAPQARRVELMRDDAAQPMQRDESGLWTIEAAAPAGSAYQYRIDGETLVPDPASRAQQQDVHGPSLVVDLTYAWQHLAWRGRPLSETVIYELHVGAMGGFAGVMGLSLIHI